MGDIEPIALEPVDTLAITALVDNVTVILLVERVLRGGPGWARVRGYRRRCSIAAKLSTRCGQST